MDKQKTIENIKNKVMLSSPLKIVDEYKERFTLKRNNLNLRINRHNFVYVSSSIDKLSSGFPEMMKYTNKKLNAAITLNFKNNSVTFTEYIQRRM